MFLLIETSIDEYQDQNPWPICCSKTKTQVPFHCFSFVPKSTLGPTACLPYFVPWYLGYTSDFNFLFLWFRPATSRLPSKTLAHVNNQLWNLDSLRFRLRFLTWQIRLISSLFFTLSTLLRWLQYFSLLPAIGRSAILHISSLLGPKIVPKLCQRLGLSFSSPHWL